MSRKEEVKFELGILPKSPTKLDIQSKLKSHSQELTIVKEEFSSEIHSSINQ